MELLLYQKQAANESQLESRWFTHLTEAFKLLHLDTNGPVRTYSSANGY
ncbi:hypothetical protein M8332_06140 [Fructilactobacillus ixorae]|uniref:PH domain-containing protein n=1 Tax=Fructilactobacillus ixorae TaxID=1750535 RepID=A0ABY5C307_9LACO|nr:hypothetical protein [Fructilactobacillus ixorae]USS93172.1 hypothetical protein M8332_06140 [Fructilactobacillus ixorae]